MAFVGMSGSVNKTADSAIGASGKPIRLFAVNMLSGGTAGELVLRNGTSASDDIWVREKGEVSTGKTVTYGQEGILFPNGCFYDDDSNFTSVTFQFAQEL
jgi:hypothetical protein